MTSESRRPKVLYVDDQAGNIVVFKASFKKQVDIVTANSGEQGLEVIQREEIPVVISDQRMDGMSGSQFLGEVRKISPDTVRMLVTAYTNFDDAVAAINDGQVARFIMKPWEPQDVLAAILSGNELYNKTRENKILTEQLLHRQRLAAIGQVTSGLVHELGNVMSVLSVVEDIEADLGSGADLSREVHILHNGVEKLRVLVESLRVYSKGGDQLQVAKSKQDMVQLVSATLVLLGLFPKVKQLKSLEFVPPAEPIFAMVDAKKIEQVVFNIVKNAAEATPVHEGVVTLSLEKSGDQVFLHVRDNGPGIPQEARAKIWNGFYSTKGDKGTGLGLSMCRKIMDAHGGSIDFVNQAGGGCTFTLSLPAA